MGSNGYQPMHIPDGGPSCAGSALPRPSLIPARSWPGGRLISEESIIPNHIPNVDIKDASQPMRPAALGQMATKKPERSLATRCQGLVSVSQAIGAHLDMEGLFSALAAELLRVVEYDFIAIAQLDEKASKIEWYVSRFGGATVRNTIDGAKEETLCAWVNHHRQPLLMPMLHRDTRLHHRIKQLAEDGLRSLYAFPLTRAHHRIGSLFIGSRIPGAYSEFEISFLSIIADMVASAAQDALSLDAVRKTHAELQRERDRLQLLLELNNQVVSNLELRDLLRSVSASVRRLMECDSVAVHLPDAETSQLRLFVLDFPGGKGLLKEGSAVPIEGCGSNHPADVFRTGKPTLAWDLESDPAGAAGTCVCGASRPGEGIRSVCALPLISRNRVLGVLELGRRLGPAFTQSESDFLLQVANQIAIATENALAYGQIAELKNQLVREKLYLEDEIRSEHGFEEIIGRSPAIRAVLRKIETVAPIDATVLIYGETGTGKELIARAIHERSPRSSNAFVKLNCAAIPTGLLESELFGHERGAFTGAVMQRIGRFELANHGTAFLDEIGEISLELQPKLLRVLQEREFERLGSSRTLRTNARLIAATNRNLAESVEQQTFRADLFYRLHVFPIHVPPLRDRVEDIPMLVRHFAQHYARQMNRVIDTVPSETMEALVRHTWPGNIRELQNLIEHSVILSGGPVLQVPLAVIRSTTPPTVAGAKRQTMEEAEREHIRATLKDTKWVISGPRGAAAILGMNRSTLQFRMKKLGITRPGL